jgi:hypothetical protein
MGNTQSSKPKHTVSNLLQEIDLIATQYITSQSIQDLKQLSDMEYCNKLLMITSDRLKGHLNEHEVKYLEHRVKDGMESNEIVQNTFTFIPKGWMESIDVQNDGNKDRICIGVAKFYVKIMHLFGAILTTVNPVYVYKDTMGTTLKVDILQAHKIPKEVKPTLQITNICTARINALLNSNNYNVPSHHKVTIQPSFCDINFDKIKYKDKTLIDEPGIPELEKLYYDVYDYERGVFNKMSESMSSVYKSDVETFYKAFTGNRSIPMDGSNEPTIRKFSDILLKDYHKGDGCKPNGVYTKQYTSSLKYKLFKSYAQHIKDMMRRTNENQDKLITILKQLFDTKIIKGKSQLIIHPALTEMRLNQFVEETRTLIVSLYLTCELDFTTGIELFEAIVEKTILDTSQKQIDLLQSSIQEKMTEVENL